MSCQLVHISPALEMIILPLRSGGTVPVVRQKDTNIFSLFAVTEVGLLEEA